MTLADATQSDIAIDVEGLTKSFDGRPAVRDLTLRVKRGTIFGFLGPNGSGKTTTIRMLCGLLTPDAGRGSCLGFDLRTETSRICGSRASGTKNRTLTLPGGSSDTTGRLAGTTSPGRK